VALGRGVTTQPHLLESITCKFTRLIGCELPDTAKDKTPRASLAIPILDEVGLCPARLDSDTEALESTVAGIPSEQISSAGIWPQ
jgi:hypothetical protein